MFVVAASNPGTELPALNHVFISRLASAVSFKSIWLKVFVPVTTWPLASFWLDSTVIGVDFSIPSVAPLISPVVETPFTPTISCLLIVNGITALFTLSLKV